MTNKTLGPMCGETNSHEIDPGTLIRACMPRPQPIGRVAACMPPLQIDALIFEEEEIVQFLHLVAHAKAAERYVKLRWKDYDESTFLNVVYTLLPFGKPGWAEVDTGDINRIVADAARDSQQLQEQFAAAMTRGGQRVAHFLNAQAEMRTSALEMVRDTFRTASEINEGVVEETRRHLGRLIAIKAAAALTLKTAAFIGGGPPAFFIGLGYDLSLNLIKNLDRGGDAVAVGLASKSWEKVWKKGVKDFAKDASSTYRGEASTAEHKASWLAKRVAEQEEELQRVSAEQLRKYGKDVRRLERAQNALSNARWGMRVMTGVKIGFFAWDVFNTVVTARDELRQAGY